MRYSLQRLVVAVCAVAVAATACSTDDSGSGTDLDEVRIGALYPLTGPIAVAGADTLHGAELAVEIINGEYPDLELPLAAEKGLPNLGDAKITLVKGDSQGVPETGASEAERLVTDEKVVALTGAYQSAVTLTASERAERLETPFVNGASSSTGLTERGLEWFFRTGPNDQMFGETFFSLLNELNGDRGDDAKLEKVAILHSNDEFGNNSAQVTRDLAEDNGFTVVNDVPYDAKAPDLTSSVQNIRGDSPDKTPDVVFLLALLPDTQRIVSAFKNLNYWPPAVLGYGGGVSDPQLVAGEEDKANVEGFIRRSAWSLEVAERNPTSKRVAEMFQEKYDLPMTENSARSFTAVMTLAMAINESGTAEPDDIRSALRNINIPGRDLIVPWDNVEFDDNHQNAGARGVLEQFIDGKWKVIYPAEVSNQNVIYPLTDSRE